MWVHECMRICGKKNIVLKSSRFDSMKIDAVPFTVIGKKGIVGLNINAINKELVTLNIKPLKHYK